MIFTIYLHNRNAANIHQANNESEKFWHEMGFAQWFMIRILSEFYESRQILPDTLAAIYIDKEIIYQYISNNKAMIEEPKEHLSNFRKIQKECADTPYSHRNIVEMELEMEGEGNENGSVLNVINSGIVQRPVFLDQTITRESGKYIKSLFPECRIEFKGFGRFFGYSDFNQIIFWTPFIILRYFYLKYCDKGDEIIKILTRISSNAGMYHAKREITIENQRELALESINSIMKKYVSS